MRIRVLFVMLLFSTSFVVGATRYFDPIFEVSKTSNLSIKTQMKPPVAIYNLTFTNLKMTH